MMSRPNTKNEIVLNDKEIYKTILQEKNIVKMFRYDLLKLPCPGKWNLLVPQNNASRK